jgi:hypothetical protein
MALASGKYSDVTDVTDCGAVWGVVIARHARFKSVYLLSAN